MKGGYLDGLNIVALHSPDNKSDFAHWFYFINLMKFLLYMIITIILERVIKVIFFIEGLYDKYNGLFKQSNGLIWRYSFRIYPHLAKSAVAAAQDGFLVQLDGIGLCIKY